jgi:hypothetical protein
MRFSLVSICIVNKNRSPSQNSLDGTTSGPTTESTSSFRLLLLGVPCSFAMFRRTKKTLGRSHRDATATKIHAVVRTPETTHGDASAVLRYRSSPDLMQEAILVDKLIESGQDIQPTTTIARGATKKSLRNPQTKRLSSSRATGFRFFRRRQKSETKTNLAQSMTKQVLQDAKPAQEKKKVTQAQVLTLAEKERVEEVATPVHMNGSVKLLSKLSHVGSAASAYVPKEEDDDSGAIEIVDDASYSPEEVQQSTSPIQSSYSQDLFEEEEESFHQEKSTNPVVHEEQAEIQGVVARTENCKHYPLEEADFETKEIVNDANSPRTEELLSYHEDAAGEDIDNEHTVSFVATECSSNAAIGTTEVKEAVKNKDIVLECRVESPEDADCKVEAIEQEMEMVHNNARTADIVFSAANPNAAVHNRDTDNKDSRTETKESVNSRGVVTEFIRFFDRLQAGRPDPPAPSAIAEEK